MPVPGLWQQLKDTKIHASRLAINIIVRLRSPRVCLPPSLCYSVSQCPVLVLSSEHFYNKLFDMWACECWNILIHNHSTYMFYFYIFYLTYSVLHGAIRRLVYDTRFAFYAVALNYVLALFLFFYLYVCLGVLLIVYLFIIFYALIKSGKIAIQIWQVVADKCVQIFVKLARCRKSQMANPTMPPLGSSCCMVDRSSLGWWLWSLESTCGCSCCCCCVCSTLV